MDGWMDGWMVRTHGKAIIEMAKIMLYIISIMCLLSFVINETEGLYNFFSFSTEILRSTEWSDDEVILKSGQVWFLIYYVHVVSYMYCCCND